ncbi:MAG: hypothetical protein GY769_01770, partial [bacterium]|nr:hypothetical protein [bacterium]
MAKDEDRNVTITISAKNLTEAEFGKVKQGLSGVEAAAANTTKKTSAMSRGFSAFGRAAPGALRAVAVGAGVAAGAVAAITAAVVKLGERGAAVADVQSQFDQLSEAAGETGAIMLGELAAGVKGTISNFELMKVANKALGAGLLTSSEDARTLAQGARLLAKRTGIDTVDAFNMMTTAMASGRTAQLKQIGLFVDNKQAIEDFAASTGKSVSQMNDADRAAALQAATMAALRGQLEMFPAPLADFGELLERGRVGVQNLLDNLSVGVSESPVFLAAMRSAGEAIKEAFGEGPELTAAIVSGLERAAFFAIGFARAGISAAQSILQGFSAVKAVVLGVSSTFAQLNETILGAVATTLEAASNIPILGAGYELAAEKARSLADTTTAISGSLQQQTQDALIAAAGNDALGQGLTRLDGVLVQFNQNMINAGMSERALTGATQEAILITDQATVSAFNWQTQLTELPHVMIDLQGNIVAAKEEILFFDTETGMVFSRFGSNMVAAEEGFGDLSEAMAAELTKTTNAFNFFGLSTQAELNALADAAEESYARMLESGAATEEALREAAEETARLRQQAQGE